MARHVSGDVVCVGLGIALAVGYGGNISVHIVGIGRDEALVIKGCDGC